MCSCVLETQPQPSESRAITYNGRHYVPTSDHSIMPCHIKYLILLLSHGEAGALSVIQLMVACSFPPFGSHSAAKDRLSSCGSPVPPKATKTEKYYLLLPPTTSYSREQVTVTSWKQSNATGNPPPPPGTPRGADGAEAPHPAAAAGAGVD